MIKHLNTPLFHRLSFVFLALVLIAAAMPMANPARAQEQVNYPLFLPLVRTNGNPPPATGCFENAWVKATLEAAYDSSRDPMVAITEFDKKFDSDKAKGITDGESWTEATGHTIDMKGHKSAIVWTNTEGKPVTLNGQPVTDSKWVGLFLNGTFGVYLTSANVTIPTAGRMAYVCSEFKPTDLSFWGKFDCLDNATVKSVIEKWHALDANNPEPAVAEFDKIFDDNAAKNIHIGVTFAVSQTLEMNGYASLLIWTNTEGKDVLLDGQPVAADKWVPVFVNGTYGLYLAYAGVTMPSAGRMVRTCTVFQPTDLDYWGK